jgi:hypothetical protein
MSLKLKQFIDEKRKEKLTPQKMKKLDNLEKIIGNRQKYIKTSSLSLKNNDKLSLLERVGKNYITLEKIRIKEWLENIENLVFIFNDEIFLLKRNDINLPNLRDIFMECVFVSGDLMVKETFSSPRQYFSLYYLTGKKIIIELVNIQKLILKTNIIQLDQASESKFISRESLILSSIGLKLGLKEKKLYSVNPDQKIKKNIPHNFDVYFDDLISKALRDYSYQWDAAINSLLRFGEPYFLTPEFHKYFKRYGKTKEQAKNAIKDKIVQLDRAFLEAAPRNEDSETLYWRGMKFAYSDLKKVGDEETILNYVSISTNRNVAFMFSGWVHGSGCCMYKIKLDKGIPYINMISNTKFKNEKEFLLPRNLKFKVVGVEQEKISLHGKEFIRYTYEIQVSKQFPEQFTIKNACQHFSIYNIDSIKIPQMEKKVKKISKKQMIENISNEIEKKPMNNFSPPNSPPHNSYGPHTPPMPNIPYGPHTPPMPKKSSKKQSDKKRCPNGTHKNKKTGECEGHKSIKSLPKELQEKKRCPNGTRKNKKTGVCEKHNA